QQPHQIGNLGRCQPVGITRAVEVFVVVPYPVENFRTNACEIPQQFISDDRMAFHDLVFNRVEASRLVENGQGNTGLAYVMQGCRYSKPLDVQAGEPEFQSEADRYARHQQAVLEGSFMISPNAVQPRAKSILRNALDD